MFPLYLQHLLIDFRQTFVTGASWDTDDLIMFLGQNVKVQGHTIAAEAHSTQRYRRVQLFLVYASVNIVAEALLCIFCLFTSLSVSQSVHLEMLLTQDLEKCWTYFHQTFSIGAFWNTDEHVTFWGQTSTFKA